MNYIAYADEQTEMDWTKLRFDNVIYLRQEGLRAARKSWADYCLVIKYFT